MILTKQKFSKKDIEHREHKKAFYDCEEGEIEIFNLMFDGGLFRDIKPEEIPARRLVLARLTEIGLLDEDKIRWMIHKMLHDLPAVMNEDDKIIKDDIEEK